MKTARELLDEMRIPYKGRTNGNFKTTCPHCSHARKHKSDPCLSVRIDDSGVGVRCHNCNYSDGKFFDGTERKTHGFSGRPFTLGGGGDKYGALQRQARQHWR